MSDPSGYVLFKHLYHKILRTKGVDTIALMRQHANDLDSYYESTFIELGTAKQALFVMAS